MKKQYTLHKAERLTNKSDISDLFSGGAAITKFPLRLIFKSNEEPANSPMKTAFAVPKRSFKHAVDRNLLKRRMREAFRLNKLEVYDTLSQRNEGLNVLLIYMGKQEFAYSKIEKAMVAILAKLNQQIIGETQPEKEL